MMYLLLPCPLGPWTLTPPSRRCSSRLLLLTALDKRQALLCILAENCDEPMYKKLITALCMEHGIPLIKVDSNMKLGEWAGPCKIDREGKARKVVKCSSCVIRDWGKEGPANDVLQEYLKANK